LIYPNLSKAQDSVYNENGSKFTLAEVVVRNNFDYKTVLQKIKDDTSFYKAFKTLRTIGYTSYNHIEMKDKRGNMQASLDSKTRQNHEGNCRTMDVLEENITGNNNTIITNVGTSAATNLATINIDVTGNTNAITVNENSASSGLTAKITDIDVTGNSNTITATKTGLGQHDTTINHTGDFGTIGVTQSGSVSSTVNLLTNGNNATVSVTITD
jgi:hypothetical protein